MRPYQAKITPCPQLPNVSLWVGFPNDPSYQDVQQQPLLLTVSYAQALQYWAEKVRLPILNDYHPLAMSIVELKQHVERHVILSKQDVFQNLGSTTPEAISWDMGISQGDTITPPTTANVGDLESSSTEAKGTDNTTPLSSGCPPEDETPLAEPTTLPAKVDVKDTPSGSAETPPGEDAMVFSTKPDTRTPKDLLTGQATSPIKVEI